MSDDLANPDDPASPADRQDLPRETLFEFPCSFPIKAMGRADSAVVEAVIEIIERHAPGLAPEAVTTRPSSGGNWVAITVVIEATHKDQLDAIYRDLSAHELVAIAL